MFNTITLTWTRSPEGHHIAVDPNGNQRFAVAREADGWHVWERDSLVGWTHGLRAHTTLKKAKASAAAGRSEFLFA